MARPLAPLAPLIPVVREVGVAVAVTTAVAGVISAIPGDNTQGDGSCPSCDAYINNARRRLEQQEAARQNIRSQDNSGNQSDSNEAPLRGSRNPQTAEKLAEGRAKHKEFGNRVEAKGWKSNPSLKDPKTGRTVRPDAVTKGGRPLELKPNTPTGRAQGR
jgi:hypothetical protein